MPYHLNGDPFSWLADFFLLAAELSEKYRVKNIVDGLVPDQHSQLCYSSGIYIDSGISEEIKDIADSVGVELRSKLLHNNMVKTLKQPGYESAYGLICELLNGEYSELEAIDDILEHLDEILHRSIAHLKSDLSDLFAYTTLLCSFGSLSWRKGRCLNRLRKCPLLTAADTVVHLTGNKLILAPVSHWPESARSLLKPLHKEACVV